MYETYMDCPHFEQMQYLMDTLLEALYTYSISTDSRLAGKGHTGFLRIPVAQRAHPLQRAHSYCTDYSGVHSILDIHAVRSLSIFQKCSLHQRFLPRRGKNRDIFPFAPSGERSAGRHGILAVRGLDERMGQRCAGARATGAKSDLQYGAGCRIAPGRLFGQGIGASRLCWSTDRTSRAGYPPLWRSTDTTPDGGYTAT